MGLIPTICRMLILLHKKVGFEGPLLTLGNQDVWADYEQLKSFFGGLECPYAEAPVIPHTSRLFAQQRETRNFVHARTFFEMMGIKEYSDIDKFEDDAPCILHDLNTPVPSEFESRFNLIIDGGTLEHIFDVRQVMENIVRMCSESGWVVHLTPSSNYVDHGFYSFSPCFFYDFYQANGFGEFFCYILQVNPENLCEPSPYFEYSYGMDMRGLLDPDRQILVFFAAKKVRASDQLVIPTQGIYESSSKILPGQSPVAVADAGTAQGNDSITERLVPAFLLPLLKPVRPFLWAARRKVTGRGREAVTSYRQLRRI
ncbi:MAG: hypothetical protein QOH63_1292 [Acidobacteriota bacterium]|nr:hypothetical protein [Acidobacteriota bacterium]